MKLTLKIRSADAKRCHSFYDGTRCPLAQAVKRLCLKGVRVTVDDRTVSLKLPGRGEWPRHFRIDRPFSRIHYLHLKKGRVPFYLRTVDISGEFLKRSVLR